MAPNFPQPFKEGALDMPRKEATLDFASLPSRQPEPAGGVERRRQPDGAVETRS
jgi:hypothetical protein